MAMTKLTLSLPEFSQFVRWKRRWISWFVFSFISQINWKAWWKRRHDEKESQFWFIRFLFCRFRRQRRKMNQPICLLFHLTNWVDSRRESIDFVVRERECRQRVVMEKMGSTEFWSLENSGKKKKHLKEKMWLFKT